MSPVHSDDSKMNEDSKMTVGQLETVSEKIRNGVDGDEIVLHGVVFLLAQVSTDLGIGSDPVTLTTKDSQQETYNELKSGHENTEKRYCDYITHVRLRSKDAVGPAVFPTREALIEALRTDNYYIG